MQPRQRHGTLTRSSARPLPPLSSALRPTPTADSPRSLTTPARDPPSIESDPAVLIWLEACVTPPESLPIVRVLSLHCLTVVATDGGHDSITVAAVEQLTIDPSAVLVEATEAETGDRVWRRRRRSKPGGNQARH